MTGPEAIETLRTIAGMATDDPPWVYADANTLAQIADALTLDDGHYCPCGNSRHFHEVSP